MLCVYMKVWRSPLTAGQVEETEEMWRQSTADAEVASSCGLDEAMGLCTKPRRAACKGLGYARHWQGWWTPMVVEKNPAALLRCPQSWTKKSFYYMLHNNFLLKGSVSRVCLLAILIVVVWHNFVLKLSYNVDSSILLLWCGLAFRLTALGSCIIISRAVPEVLTTSSKPLLALESLIRFSCMWLFSINFASYLDHLIIEVYIQMYIIIIANSSSVWSFHHSWNSYGIFIGIM